MAECAVVLLLLPGSTGCATYACSSREHRTALLYGTRSIVTAFSRIAERMRLQIAPARAPLDLH
jgi:hypothetical protein